ncbi:MAG: prepilin-type N-terminal cleavage/methylation domain-containing protein [Deltaproteobacteria bacterium]|nr:prepilin-type N-terminal cleavage/methylation domain-containing protein [Deltaproteobacteria bacterium]
MISKLANREEGFTLIELMIVIAIIGILAAIAIPQFSAYRKRSYNSAAQSDVRNIATAQEAYYIDESTYCNDYADLTGSSYGYYQSGNVTVSTSGTADVYTITGYNSSGDKTYSLSGPGGTIGTTS